MNIKHSSESCQHFLPPNYASSVRKVLEPTFIDVASSDLANQIIQAGDFLTCNGLAHTWHGSVYCNPPGGKDEDLKERFDTSSSIGAWFKYLLEQYKEGAVTEAIFIGFQLSLLKTCPESIHFPFCIPKQRIRFWTTTDQLFDNEICKKNPNLDALNRYIERCKVDPNKHIDYLSSTLVPSRAPSQDNIIFYLPHRDNSLKKVLFKNEFSQYGEVKI